MRFRPNGRHVHRLSLICDVCGREFTRAIPAESPEEARDSIREVAAREGWTFPGSHDICPEDSR